jgi:ubiquinol oxidase
MIRPPVSSVVSVINKLYRGRPFARFYVLETLACVPHYVHLSVLNLYKNFGFWRQVDWLESHVSESWNELQHLLIMETLEGDKFWYDRLLARSLTIVYYWMLMVVYVVHPQGIDRFRELLATHAYDDYSNFLDECKQELITRPAPRLTSEDGQEKDFFLLDAFGTDATEYYPPTTNLYDVFSAIQAQEMECIKMMLACQKSSAKVKGKVLHTLARP